MTQYQRAGVNVFQSATNNIFIGLRILDTTPGYFDQFASAYMMARLDGRQGTCRFITGKDVEWSATAPRGLDYWKLLSDIVNEEPVRPVDKAWMAMLLPLGIEKGKRFDPDERQQSVLLKGAAMGELMNRNLQVNPRFAEAYWPGTSWYKSFDFHIAQETDTHIELDERATWFYEAVTSTQGMVNPTPGAGQVDMTTKRDSNVCGV
ncbi:hypothetical protein [Mycobacterium colombiense]|uniref:hypothetical protein n=1 Tax=Mycobacterium colombiense TaxID=339268 RepID=UPI000AA30251|nr:hypothetical protein [Mycobacterium colombiense]